MVAEPTDIPVTTPELDTVPTAVLLLLHVPPEQEWLSVVVDPWHTANEPVIGGMVSIMPAHLYHCAELGEVAILVVKVEEDGVGVAEGLLSVWKSVVLFAMPIVAEALTNAGNPL